MFLLLVALHASPSSVGYCGSESVDVHLALMQACGTGNTLAVQEMLGAEHDDEQCYAHKGPTLLMAAANAGAVDIVRLLLSKYTDAATSAAYVNVVVDPDEPKLQQPREPWIKLTAAHYALDGWFAQATRSFALFERPWGPPLPSVAAQHDR